MIVDEETAEKINRRTVTFQTANSIYLPRVAALYRIRELDLMVGKGLQWTYRTSRGGRYVKECLPLSVDDGGNNSANKP